MKIQLLLPAELLQTNNTYPLHILFFTQPTPPPHGEKVDYELDWCHVRGSYVSDMYTECANSFLAT